MASSSAVSAKCPYPGCAGGDDSAEPLSGGVYRCPRCFRLSMRCGYAGCEALNRPFSRFCRRCSVSLFSRDRDQTISQQWQQAGAFQESWRFPAPTNPEAVAVELGPPATVADLQQAQGLRVADVLIPWRFVDGLLAIHQGGGLMALAHPFGDGASGARPPALLWSQPEKRYVDLPDVDYRAETFRPYPPAVTCDRRFLIFSTPYAAFVLDLCSLPGWTFDGGDAAFHKLIDLAACPEARLAAAPIPLTADKAGILLYQQTLRQYSWSVLDLATRDVPAERLLENSRPLRVEGALCQYEMLDDLAIAIATQCGHWVWRCSDALRLATDAMARTWPAGESRGRMVLDFHVEKRSRLSRQRQFLCRPTSRAGRGAPPAGFEWCYLCAREGVGPERFEGYDVNLTDLTHRWPGPPSEHGMWPIGQRRPEETASPELLFIAPGDGGELYRRVRGTGSLSPLGVFTKDRNLIQGLLLEDPLLTIVSEQQGRKHYWQVSLYTVPTCRNPAEVQGLELVADPIVWSRWLFTCERQGHTVLVHRREIPISPRSKEP